MHARIDQLLSLRDGEPVDASVRAHVQQCTHCLTEAASLAERRARLRELPAFDASPHLWSQIVAREEAPPLRRKRYGLVAAAGTVILGVLALLAVRDVEDASSVASVSPDSRLTPQIDTQTLIAQSRELDELLQYLPQRPLVERVSLAATVDSIEERIQVLDWQLAYGSDAGLDHRQAHRLWSERVELMDSLVKVRYAESAPMTF